MDQGFERWRDRRVLRARLIVWKPRRVVPSFAVPVIDVVAQLVPASVPLGVERPVRPGAVVPDDPELEGYVVLDWAALDQWREEDDVVMGHPHDPVDRIDVLRSSRHVVVSSQGVVLADSSRPTLLLETPLPTR